MKIFRLLSPLPSVLTVPDTALLIQKRPFFIPDFTQDCRAQLCAVIRITRLGRSIGERFVPRYYQAEQISLGVHFVAH
ncbi:2-hydroxyhepta-2,4-diene-1,7-dioate isomerase, fumarylacetoacetate hydrolase family protein, partial [gut metagenome]